jgi:uncharacterized membrane protein YdjX (TVP38/TMEM64 family)
VNNARARRLIVAAAWVALAGGAALWAIATGRGPEDVTTDLVDAIQGSAWGPLAFLAVYLARPLIFFSASVLTVAGGFLFGAVTGIALVVLASNGSAMVAYGLARWLGGERRADPDAAGRLARWARRLRDRSFETVIVMRLVYLPYDLVSYLAGALRIHPLAFLAGTAIGSAPATVAFVLFGASLESFDGGVPKIDGPILITSGVLLVTGLAVSKLLGPRGGEGDSHA